MLVHILHKYGSKCRGNIKNWANTNNNIARNCFRNFGKYSADFYYYSLLYNTIIIVSTMRNYSFVVPVKERCKNLFISSNNRNGRYTVPQISGERHQKLEEHQMLKIVSTSKANDLCHFRYLYRHEYPQTQFLAMLLFMFALIYTPARQPSFGGEAVFRKDRKRQRPQGIFIHQNGLKRQRRCRDQRDT